MEEQLLCWGGFARNSKLGLNATAMGSDPEICAMRLGFKSSSLRALCPAWSIFHSLIFKRLAEEGAGADLGRVQWHSLTLPLL